MPPTVACGFVWWAQMSEEAAKARANERRSVFSASPFAIDPTLQNRHLRRLILLECGLTFLHGHPIHSKVFLLQGRGSTCRCRINLNNYSRLHWNVGLGKGWVGSFLGTYDDPCFPLELKCNVLSHNTLLKKRQLRPWRLGMDKE